MIQEEVEDGFDAAVEEPAEELSSDYSVNQIKRAEEKVVKSL